MNETIVETRKFTVQDIKDIRLLLFGKHGRGMFEVRTSPADNGTEDGGPDTADSRKWDTDGSGIGCDFPVHSCETTSKHRLWWPDVYEGIELDLYVRRPDPEVGMNAPRDDWEMENEAVRMKDGKWEVVHA